MTAYDSNGRPSLIVFWILWFSIFNGLFIILFIVGGGWPSGVNKGSPETWKVAIPVAAAIASLAVRFLVIPKINDFKKLLPVMLIGLALAEMVGVFGVLLVGKDFPQTKQVLIVTGVSLVIAHAPIYLARILEREKLLRNDR